MLVVQNNCFDVGVIFLVYKTYKSITYENFFTVRAIQLSFACHSYLFSENQLVGVQRSLNIGTHMTRISHLYVSHCSHVGPTSSIRTILCIQGVSWWLNQIWVIGKTIYICVKVVAYLSINWVKRCRIFHQTSV